MLSTLSIAKRIYGPPSDLTPIWYTYIYIYMYTYIYLIISSPLLVRSQFVVDEIILKPELKLLLQDVKYF